MDTEQFNELIEEARRIIQEATLTGFITLNSGDKVELGTKKADSILRTAENLAKQKPPRLKRISTDADFVAPNTEG